MIFVGVDIGLKGAVAAIIEGTGGPTDLVLRVWDMPTLRVTKSRPAYDPQGIAELARQINDSGLKVAILWEECHSKFSNTAMSLGLGMGMWTGVAAMLGWGRFTCSAHAWKKHFRLLKTTKGASRLKAQGIFPDADLGKRGSEDRAEAVLLAMYCRRIVCGGPT